MRKTKTLIFSALFAAVITVMTAYICHIPFGTSGGYFHLGDAVIFLAASLLPKPYAVASAIIGGGLADLLTAPLWIIPTVIIKGLICLPFTSKKDKIICKRNVFAVTVCAVITVVGYALAEAIIFGSFISAVYNCVGNIFQAVFSAVLYILLGLLLDKNKLTHKLK